MTFFLKSMLRAIVCKVRFVVSASNILDSISKNPSEKLVCRWDLVYSSELTNHVVLVQVMDEPEEGIAGHEVLAVEAFKHGTAL